MSVAVASVFHRRHHTITREHFTSIETCLSTWRAILAAHSSGYMQITPKGWGKRMVARYGTIGLIHTTDLMGDPAHYVPTEVYALELWDRALWLVDDPV